MFKEGDKVRVIREPIFITMPDNGIWDVYPTDYVGMFGEENTLVRADMSHLIGLEATIKHVLVDIFGGIFYFLSFPPGTEYPVGLEPVTEEYIEKI